MASLITSVRLALLAGATLAAGETGVRRMAKSGVIEVTAVGPVKRQSPSEDGEGSLAEDSSRLRCQISTGSVPARALDSGEFTIQSRHTRSAQECAQLCAAEAKCKTFYHVKDSKHAQYKQCTLTSWAGHLDQLAPNDCCDSGFPCSAGDLIELRLEAPNVTVFPVRALPEAPHRPATTGSPKMEAPKTVFPVKDLPYAPHRPLKTTGAPNVEKHASTEDTPSSKEIQRLNHALDIRQHKMTEKDIVIAADTSEIKHLNHALDIRQRKMIEKDTENAQYKNEERRLNHALDIRQKIFVEKDTAMAEEKTKETRLQAEVNSLNEELAHRLYYVYSLTAALAFSTTVLLGLVVYIVLDRWNSLPAWLPSMVAKQKTSHVQSSNNDQLVDPQKNGQ